MANITIVDKFNNHIESHTITGSLIDWMKETSPSFNEHIAPLYSATLNGNHLPFAHQKAELSEDDEVVITIEPQDPVTAVLTVIAVLSAAYSIYQSNQLPSGYENASEPGKSIYAPANTSNSLTPSGLIRSNAGMPTIYPDLICKPRRRYEDGKEFLYLNMCVGEGYYNITDESLYVAETPMINYSEDITKNVYEPGDDLSNDAASGNWYQSKEISRLSLVTEGNVVPGVWTVDTKFKTMTFKLNGVEVESPYKVGDDFEVTEGVLTGFYRVVSLKGDINQEAEVAILEPANGDTGRLEVVALQSTSGYGTTFHRRIFDLIDGGQIGQQYVNVSLKFKSINGGVNWEGPFLITPENELATKSEVDVSFPAGLSDGDNETEVEIQIQWREYGSTEWRDVTADTVFREATYDQLGYTIEIDYGGAIRPEHRYRRVTRDSDDINVSSDVNIERTKSLLETPTSYPDITVLTLKMAGTNALASTAENKINLRGASRKLPTLDQLKSGQPYSLKAADTTIDTRYDVEFNTFVSAAGTLGFGDCFTLSRDGKHLLKAYMNTLRYYELTEAFNINTAVFRQEKTYSSASASPAVSIVYSPTGEHFAVVQNIGGNATFISQTMVTQYDISTSVSASIHSVPGLVAQGFNTFYDGGLFYWVADNTARVFRCSNGAAGAWDFGDVDLETSFDGVLDGVPDPINSLYFLLDPDQQFPSKFNVTTLAGGVYTYDMAVPGQVPTAILDKTVTNPFSNGPTTPIWSNSSHAMAGENGTNYLGEETFYIRQYRLQETADLSITRSPARYVANALMKVMGDEGIDAIDWPALEAFDTLTESRGEYLDAEFVDEATLWDVIKIALSVGYAEPILKQAQFSLVRNDIRDGFDHMYTPDIMIESLTVNSAHDVGVEADGVDVEYFSIETNQNEVIECRAPGDIGVNPKRVQAIGITNKTQAYRFGMRQRMHTRLKPNEYRFSTEQDALNSSYGDVIAIASDLFASQYGEVLDVLGGDVELSFDPIFKTGEHFAAFRNREGRMSGLYRVSKVSANVIRLESPTVLDFTPVLDGAMDSTFVAFGSSDEWGVKAVVKEISPSGEGEVEVVAEEYIEELYTYDNLNP